VSWKRLATYALGGASIVAGALIPVAAPYLVPAGIGLLGLATPLPEKPKSK
jgi:hypothetical protein